MRTAQEPEEEEEEVFDFRRAHSVENVSADQLEFINELYRTDGVKFVDPAFTPSAGSLYENPSVGSNTWACAGCKRPNPCPASWERVAVPQWLSHVRQSLPGNPPHLKCSSCGRPESMELLVMRPVDWKQPKDVVDHLTMQTSTAPWVVFREEPRPEDVIQVRCKKCSS
jgi:hypothetical protein